VFSFPAQLLSETFLILRRNERDMIKMFIGLHVNYPLFFTDFNATWILWTYFRKIFKYQIPLKSVQWEPRCFMRTDRRTDRTKLILVFFCSFAKAPKKGSEANVCRSCECWIRTDFVCLMLRIACLSGTGSLWMTFWLNSYLTILRCMARKKQFLWTCGENYWIALSVQNSVRSSSFDLVTALILLCVS